MKFKTLCIFALCAFAALAQTTTTPAAPVTPAPATPAITLPAYFAVYGSYNQIGSPQFAVTLDGIYTTTSQNSIGMVNDTTVDLTPAQIKDASTGKSFYSLSAQLNQCLMERIIATGKFRFYGGMCGGPEFASTTSSISLSMSGSFKGVAQYRLNSWLSFVSAVRANYISGEGWNPIVQAGLSFDLKKLPAAK